MRLTFHALRQFILCYIALPVLIFAVGFLRWYWALPVCAALLFALFRGWRPNALDALTGSLTVPVGRLIALALIVLVWTHLGGMNGLSFQSDDWHWRNAIFHDLVDKPWPVVYAGKNSALVYYVGFWLPPALAAKAVGAASGSVVLAWRVARFGLWLWSSMGMTLLALGLMFFTGADSRRKQWTTLLVLIFFSGLDVVGAALSGTLERVFDPAVLHLEWWTLDGKQYSSITTCLYWVFNQSIIPWMTVLLFLTEKDARNYLLLGVSCLCCGPLPFVGLVICMLGQWAAQLIADARRGRARVSLRAALSASNLALTFLLLPLFAAYYMSNAAFGGSAPDALSLAERLDAYFSRRFLLFFMVDAGVYLALLWPGHRSEPLFYVVGASLLVIPFFRVGFSEDFCLRASLPGVFILMAWCARQLVGEFSNVRLLSPVRKALLGCLTAALLVGALTPAVEIGRGVYHVVSERTVRLSKDAFGTIEVLNDAKNFTADDYENTFFFKYLARTPRARS